jgi:hypothetical protein
VHEADAMHAASATPAALAVFACAWAVGLTACAGSVRSASVNASRAATPVIVDESLASFEDPENRERFRAIVGTPEMQAAIRETAQGLVQGALAPNGETQGRAAALAAQMTDAVADELARDIPEKLEPASVEAVQKALGEALTPEAQRSLRAAVTVLLDDATRTALRSLADEMPKTIGPAIRATIVQSLNSPDLRAALTGSAADATRAALMESRDVIRELRQEDDGPIARLVTRVQRMLYTAVLALAAVALLCTGLLGWSIYVYQSAKRERSRRTPQHAYHLSRRPIHAR